MWVRGLKHDTSLRSYPNARSHPMWVRGLKPHCVASAFHGKVAPYVGAWIETSCPLSASALRHVAPYVGAWIET